MTGNEPESANRWATEHYGFIDEPADGDARAADQAADARSAPSRHGARHSRRRAGLIASAVLSLALVGGVGGVAVASDDGPDGGRHATSRLDGGAGRGDRGLDGRRGDHS